MDNKNLDTALYLFGQISRALETVQVESKRHNLDTLLGCMQLCDKGIAALTDEKKLRTTTSKEDKENERAERNHRGHDQ